MMLLICSALVWQPSAYAESPVLKYYGPAGADVQTLCADLRIAGRICIGTASGRIFCSIDGGGHWQQGATPSTKAGFVVEAIVAGFGGNDFFAGIRHEDGLGYLWTSQDGGKTWGIVENSLALPAIRALAVTTVPVNTLFAGTTEGLWSSTDQGQTWDRIFVPAPSSSVASLATISRESPVLYLGTWRRGFKSMDGGRNFSPIWKNMAEDSHVFGFVIHPLKKQQVYAATCGWVYRSENGGESWLIGKNGLADRRIYSLAMLPSMPETLFAGTATGLYVSNDGGKLWRKGAVQGPTIRAIVIDRFNEKIYLGLDGQGILVSDNKGATFTAANDGLLASQVNTFSIRSGEVWSAATFSSQIFAVFSYFKEGDRFQIREFNADMSSPLTVWSGSETDPSCPFVLLGSSRGLYRLVCHDSYEVKMLPPPGPIRKILFDPAQPGDLRSKGSLFILAGNGLYHSGDFGDTWINLKPDDYSGECLDLVIDASDRRRLLLSTLIGVYRSDDRGRTWKFSSFRLPKQKTPVLIQDPRQPMILHALTVKGLYRSNDLGESWQQLVAYGLPNASFMLHHPRVPDCILANDMKDGGLYLSRNSGMSWNPVAGFEGIRILSAGFFLNPPGIEATLLLGTVDFGLIETKIPQ
jgi:photosystem II stability/assembly factor-like uncharacterized protein